MTEGCRQAESLAGAIALGEATETERDRYRRHIAACSSCLNELGGERDIERVMETVSHAREGETWEPVPATVQSKRQRRLRSLVRIGTPAAVLAMAVSVGAHFMIATTVKPIAGMPAEPELTSETAMHVALEHRVPEHTPRPQAPRVFVVHNVITLKAPSIARTESSHSAAPVSAPSETKTTTVVAQAPAAPAADSSDVPIWRRGSDPIRHRTTVPSQYAATPTLVGRAESIAMTPSMTVRDVVPIGGDTAINPEPPMIAYREGAEGTTAFEVAVDERGLAMKCTITKSSGYLVLDEAVCSAAMKARFSPKLVNGRAVPSIYRDAFTFRNTTNNEGIQ